jgi:hypothetical protein
MREGRYGLVDKSSTAIGMGQTKVLERTDEETMMATPTVNDDAIIRLKSSDLDSHWLARIVTLFKELPFIRVANNQHIVAVVRQKTDGLKRCATRILDVDDEECAHTRAQIWCSKSFRHLIYRFANLGKNRGSVTALIVIQIQIEKLCPMRGVKMLHEDQ